MKNKHQQVEEFIQVIRESFHDSVIVYRWGGCYGLHRILKHQFPEARAYFSDGDRDHIITKIGGRFYEIKGEVYVCGNGKCPDCKPPKALSKKDHEHWCKVSYGQRIEEMLSKYDERYSRPKR